MKTVFHQVTDAPTHPDSGTVIAETRFVATGSTIGRVLFTDWAPFVELCRVRNVVIRNCEFVGFGAVGIFT